MALNIFVDGDACPVKDEVYRVASRTGVPVTVVANNGLRMPRDPLISLVIVDDKADAADDYIAERAGVTSIVITADIPLAAEVVANGGQALDPRGELYTDANIGERLAVRNLFDELRGGGQITGGPSNFTAKDRQAFANQLDRWLTASKG